MAGLLFFGDEQSQTLVLADRHAVVSYAFGQGQHMCFADWIMVLGLAVRVYLNRFDVTCTVQMADSMAKAVPAIMDYLFSSSVFYNDLHRFHHENDMGKDSFS